MDKKAQIQYDPRYRNTPFGPHPIFLIGIFVIVIKFAGFYFGLNLPNWTYWIGIVLILIGGAISILDNSNIGY